MNQLDRVREKFRRDQVFDLVHTQDYSNVDVSHGQILYVEDVTVR